MQSIIEAIEEGRLSAQIKVVFSDRSDAYALERAAKHNLKGVHLDPKGYDSREDFDKEVVRILEENGVELVIMAGFMRILSPYFIRAFPMRIMNIHPAVLPSFPGLHVQKKALEHGAKFSGCTVHFADEGVDTGPIIIQGAVPILDGDTEETLSQRILKHEHQIYPRAIQLYAEGRLSIQGRRVIVEGSPQDSGDTFMINPPLE
jgi:phosphoribosylglycinamide formyltransferase-1